MVLKFALKPIHIQVLVLLFLLLVFNIGFSQTKGTISGKVIDKKTGEELIGVAVGIKGTSMGGQTDLEGRYQISAAPGVYTLAFIYIGYNTVEMANVEVKSGEVNYINLSLEESVNQLEEVVIQAESVKESASFVLLERKNAAQVSDGISADLIRKTPDRTTSDVLKRVTGASIQDGKFAIIRGMSDRYNAGYLNGAPLPSTESDRKAFSFDVIPANLVDNIQIIKAGTPDLIGDFGGGIILINTKNIPEKLTQSLSIGGQYNTLTTFKEFKSFKGSSTDFLGLVGASRKLPDFDRPMSAEQGGNSTDFIEGSKKFDNDWTLQKFNAGPNTRLNYSIGTPFKLFNKDFGVVAALNYSSTLRFIPSEVKTYTPQDGYLYSSFQDNVYDKNYTSGGLINLSCKLNSQNLISFRNLINVNSNYTNLMRESVIPNLDGFNNRTNADLVNISSLYSGQLSGDHSIKDGFLKIKWNGNYGDINRQQPDNKIALYNGEFAPYELTAGGFPNNGTGRFYSFLREKIYSGSLDITKPFTLFNIKSEAKIGGYIQERGRTFTSKYYEIGGNNTSTSLTSDPSIDLNQDVIGSGVRFYVDRTQAGRDNYSARSNLVAVYAMLDHKFFARLRAVYGMRFENYRQEITSGGLGAASGFSSTVTTTIGVWLPSLNLTYSVTDKSNLRAAIYKTVNRPEFRELAQFPYYQQQISSLYRGSDSLKMAEIYNFEVRYEFFPSGGQVLSAGFFYKQILKPIEIAIDVTQPNPRTFYYRNEKSAVNYGFELEFRKSLDFIGKLAAPKVFDNIFVYSNLAIIFSKIDFDKLSPSKEGRPMQGQSPYVVNAGISYENSDLGLSASVNYNKVGRRIAFAGGPAFQPFGFDIWENPRDVIDIQVGKSIKNFDIKFTIGDLLRQDLVFYQDVDENGKFNDDKDYLTLRQKIGSTYSLSVGYKF